MRRLIEDVPSEKLLEGCQDDVTAWLGIFARAQCHQIHSALLCTVPEDRFPAAFNGTVTDPSLLCAFVAHVETGGIEMGDAAFCTCRDWLSRNWQELDFHPGHGDVTVEHVIRLFSPELPRKPLPFNYECTVENAIRREKSFGNLVQIMASGEKDHVHMADERLVALGKRVLPPRGRGIVFIDGSKSMATVSSFNSRWCDMAFAAIGSMHHNDTYVVHSSIERLPPSIDGMSYMRRTRGNAYRAGLPFSSMMENDSAPDWMTIISDSEAVPYAGTQEHAGMLGFMQKFPDTLITFCNLDVTCNVPDEGVISSNVYIHGFSDRTPAVVSVANDTHVRQACAKMDHCCGAL